MAKRNVAQCRDIQNVKAIYTAKEINESWYFTHI
jgi:hypothetical protein